MDQKNFKQLQQKAQRIQTLFVKNKWSLAVAESLTGGLLSYALTLNSGASKFFLGGVLSYSFLAKIKTLNVPPTLLKNQGAVNAQVARFMAQGVKKNWDSDYALAITGVAGPKKGKKDPDIGTIFVACAGPKTFNIKKLQLVAKDRKEIQRASVVLALDFLQDHISNNTSSDI